VTPLLVVPPSVDRCCRSQTLLSKLVLPAPLEGTRSCATNCSMSTAVLRSTLISWQTLPPLQQPVLPLKIDQRAATLLRYQTYPLMGSLHHLLAQCQHHWQQLKVLQNAWPAYVLQLLHQTQKGNLPSEAAEQHCALLHMRPAAAILHPVAVFLQRLVRQPPAKQHHG
jgi:hypothetical protein